MSNKDKTCLYVCRPRQGGKTIEQLRLLISRGITKIVVEESNIKKQRDKLLDACKELAKLVEWYLFKEQFDHSPPCGCENCQILNKSKAIIAEAEAEKE